MGAFARVVLTSLAALVLTSPVIAIRCDSHQALARVRVKLAVSKNKIFTLKIDPFKITDLAPN